MITAAINGKYLVVTISRVATCLPFRWFCNTSGRARNVLPEATQKAFLAKEFVSFEFTNLSPDQEEDLFARVQMGVQLTAAEKMRATTGPWQELAKVFVEDFPHVFSLLKDRTRARDFQMALACFSQILEVQHPTNPNGFPGWKTNVKIVEKFILNQAALDDGTRSHLAAVFRKFNDLILLEPELFKNTGKKLKGVQSFAPIEMVTIAVMISMYGDERNDRLLLGDIRYMRNLLRENYIDLRMNLPMWRFIWDFIDKLEQVRGAVDGSTVNKQKQLKPPSTSTGATPAKKRGRPRIEDEPPITATASGTAKRRPDAVEPPQQKRSRVMPQPAVVKQEPADPTELPPFPPFPTSPVGSNTYQSPTATSSARPFDPRQARLNRIAELNSYRAPVASMSSTAPPATVPMTTYAPQAFTAPITLPYQRTPSQRVTPVQPAPPGFAVYLNDRITDNIQRQNRTAEPIKSEYPRSSATYTTSLRDRPAPREPDDAIDLTSDTEIESERQNLLSSFRSQATNGKATAQLHAQGTPRRKASSSNDSRRSAARDSKIQPVVLDDY
jgi:hypothetical protein